MTLEEGFVGGGSFGVLLCFVEGIGIDLGEGLAEGGERGKEKKKEEEMFVHCFWGVFRLSGRAAENGTMGDEGESD